jgi:hypothetical protein
MRTERLFKNVKIQFGEKRTITLGPKWLLLFGMVVLLFSVTACLDSGTNDNTQNSIDAAAQAQAKWGPGNKYVTNYTEYHRLQTIYGERDNPKLITNVYLYSDMTGQFTCFGQALGYAFPYSTEISQPTAGVANGGQSSGSIPEPNGVYPSQATMMDWIDLLNPDGTTSTTQVEPNMVITTKMFPCTPLKGTTATP